MRVGCRRAVGRGPKPAARLQHVGDRGIGLLADREPAAQCGRRGDAAHYEGGEAQSGKEAVRLAAPGGYGTGDLFGAKPVGILRGRADQGSGGTASSSLLGDEDLLYRDAW